MYWVAGIVDQFGSGLILFIPQDLNYITVLLLSGSRPCRDSKKITDFRPLSTEDGLKKNILLACMAGTIWLSGCVPRPEVRFDILALPDIPRHASIRSKKLPLLPVEPEIDELPVQKYNLLIREFNQEMTKRKKYNEQAADFNHTIDQYLLQHRLCSNGFWDFQKKIMQKVLKNDFSKTDFLLDDMRRMIPENGLTPELEYALRNTEFEIFVGKCRYYLHHGKKNTGKKWLAAAKAIRMTRETIELEKAYAEK